MEMNCKIEDGGVKTFALDYMPVVVVVFFFLKILARIELRQCGATLFDLITLGRGSFQ